MLALLSWLPSFVPHPVMPPSRVATTAQPQVLMGPPDPLNLVAQVGDLKGQIEVLNMQLQIQWAILPLGYWAALSFFNNARRGMGNGRFNQFNQYNQDYEYDGGDFNLNRFDAFGSGRRERVPRSLTSYDRLPYDVPYDEQSSGGTYTGVRPARRSNPFRPATSMVPPGQRRMDRGSRRSERWEYEDDMMGRMGTRSAPELFLENIFSPSSQYQDDPRDRDYVMRGSDYERYPMGARRSSRDMFMGNVYPSDDSAFGVPEGSTSNSALTKRARRARQQWMNGDY